MDERIFVPDRVPMTDQRSDSTHQELNEPVSWSGGYRTMCDTGQLHPVESLPSRVRVSKGYIQQVPVPLSDHLTSKCPLLS